MIKYKVRTAAMRLLILSILLSLALCQDHSAHRALQFHNKTSSRLTPEQFSFFVQVANYASRVYGDNIEKNLKYIKAKMDQFYAQSDRSFQVFIQTDQEVVNWSIMVFVQSVYAAVEGINELYPKWSYFFSLNFGSTNISEYVYFHSGMASGLTKDLFNAATAAILDQEGPSCGCELDGLKYITDTLYLRTIHSWSIICSNLDTTYSLVKPYENQWMAIRPKNCYYSIFS